VAKTQPFLLYHWSPSSRRKGILRRGLVPGSRSVDRAWKPPYVCYADSPSLAWSLAKHRPGVESWDLWMTRSDCLAGYEVLYFDNGTRKEVRVYERIFKRDLWYVGTRAGRVP